MRLMCQCFPLFLLFSCQCSSSNLWECGVINVGGIRDGREVALEVGSNQRTKAVASTCMYHVMLRGLRAVRSATLTCERRSE